MLKKIYSYYSNLPVSFNKIVLASLIISLFFILKAYTNHLINDYNYSFSWLLITLKISISYLLWIILTPLAYSLTKVIQSLDHFKLYKVFQFLLGCFVLAIIHQLIASRLDDLINYVNSGYLKSFLGHNSMVVLIIGSFSSFIELLVIIAIFLAYDYQKKFIVNQKALIASQLNALRMQLQPHFLFNTLHSIASMIDIDTKNAQKMLTKLGMLLRHILEYDAEQMVTVKDELNFIKDYLDLEQVRYKDRVTITYNISQDALHLKIPNMIFQPLVENAVKYGIIPTVNNGEIKINIELDHNDVMQESALTLEISNTFNNNKNHTKPIGTGTGLLNIKKRLQQFYGNRFWFKADFKTPELYSAKIVLPIIE
ncbi:histidine kinase [uncultured Psychroserpens sp.]|uniref:sensor histidine kinase n=1 Tax=uncultured Psychroserpens sp. TaxID=255436 RepID=UPI00261D9168|nr:histidine kinase [uncultured Psychroserpens sp.]